MTSEEQLCLTLDNFEDTIKTTWQQLLDKNDFCDVTLACDDENIQAHKIVISSCSPVFRNILKSNVNQYPLIYLRGVKYKDLDNLIKFMYQGELNIGQDELQGFLSIAEDLRVKGGVKSLFQKGDNFAFDQIEKESHNDSFNSHGKFSNAKKTFIQNVDIENFIKTEVNDKIENLIEPEVIESEQILGKVEERKSNGKGTVTQKQTKLKKSKQTKCAFKNKSDLSQQKNKFSLPLLPDPIFEIKKEEPIKYEVKTDADLLNVDETQVVEDFMRVDTRPLKDKKSSHKQTLKKKTSDDIKILSLSPLLLKEKPHKFRFFRRDNQMLKAKEESEEEFETRKSSYYANFPGLIVDGELTTKVVCIGCGFIGSAIGSWLPGHLNVCKQNAEHLKNKEIEVVKHRYMKSKYRYQINQHFKQVQVDKFECNICKKVFPEMNVFQVHLSEVHLIETNGRKFKNTLGKFQCSECGKKLINMGILKQHQITAHGKMEFVKHKCEECGANFCTEGKYNLHFKAKHSDERPYMCDICPKSFKVKKHLDSHTNIHTGVKSWKCRHCEKSFSKDWTRTQHERLHLGIKPYKCEHCTAAFSQRSSLDSHEKVHHGDNKILKMKISHPT